MGAGGLCSIVYPSELLVDVLELSVEVVELIELLAALTVLVDHEIVFKIHDLWRIVFGDSLLLQMHWPSVGIDISIGRIQERAVELLATASFMVKVVLHMVR